VNCEDVQIGCTDHIEIGCTGHIVRSLGVKITLTHIGLDWVRQG
jgi:hypothetical protein